MSDFDPFAVMRTLDGPVDPPESFGEELYTALRVSMDQHAVGAPVEEPLTASPSPRRGLLVAAAVVVAFFAMGGLLALLAPPGDPEANIDPLPLSEPDETSPTSLVEHNEDPSVASPPETGGATVPSTTVAAQHPQQSRGGYQFGGWNVLPTSEFDGRLGAAVVWTGDQLLVWGGEVPGDGIRPSRGWPTTNEGGFYDPGAGIWLSLPPSPLSARSGVTALWSGTEMLIIGTEGQDGAAYDPATRLWRELPRYWVPADPAAVWTGTEVILWGGIGHSGVAYNPSADSWRNIAEANLNTWNNATAVWTGDEMIMWNEIVRGRQSGATQAFALDVAAYDPAANTWRRFPPQDFEFELSNASGVWTGGELVLMGANFERLAREGEFANAPPILGIALDPATGVWRSLAPSPFVEEMAIEGFGIHSSVWAGDRLLLWAGSFFTASPVPELWAYDPASDEWARGASAPTAAADPDLIWDGSTLYAYGGDVAAARRVMTLNLPPGEPLPPPIAPANTFELPSEPPFEILALEPFVQSAFVGSFPDGVGRFYERGDTFLQRDAISRVVPLHNGWMTSANGEVWWFEDSISRLPVALQNEPETNPAIAGVSYFLPTRGDLNSDHIWTVVPGTVLVEDGAPSIVRSISIDTRLVRTYTEAPPNARPVSSSATGLLLNGFEWLETAGGLVEDPATRTMILVEPDGTLRPLWPGIGIDLSGNRVVWLDCGEGGGECRIVVSSLSGPSPADLTIEVPGLTTRSGAVSPNGRWLIVEIGGQGGPGQALVRVDLTDGSFDEVFPGRGIGTFAGPSVTWSNDSNWVLILDGGPVAVRLDNGFTIDLAPYLPEGMVVYGVASR